MSTAELAKSARHSGIELFARLGYLTRGVVYIIIGVLAALAAQGSGGATTDSQGAIQTIYSQPFGQLLLGIVALGFFGYAIWCFTRAIVDADKKGTNLTGIVTRIGYGVAGISYLVLAYTAFRLLTGSGNTGNSSDASTQDWTAWLLEQPFGPFLVGIIGLVVIGAALTQFYRAYSIEFQKYLRLGELSAQRRELLVSLGRLGLAARGVVFGIIGIFLIVAVWRHNPGEAKGLGGALQEVAQQPYGGWLLLLIACGLIAYGVYSLAAARYRRIRTS